MYPYLNQSPLFHHLVHTLDYIYFELSLILISDYHIYHVWFFVTFYLLIKPTQRRTEWGRGGSTASAPVELGYVPGEQGSHADAPVKGERKR